MTCIYKMINRNHTSRYFDCKMVIISVALLLAVSGLSQAVSAQISNSEISLSPGFSEPSMHPGSSTEADKDGIRVGPNPFTPNNNGFNDFVTFDFSNSGTGSGFIVRIFDMNGKHVRTLRTNGRSDITWNGSDSGGTVLKPGIYLYIIESNNSVVRRGSVTLAL